MKTIYICLLDEGTEVLRPTEAGELDNGLFKLLPAPGYDPDDEHWEFTLGSVVRGVIRKLEGEAVLVAVSVNYDGGENALTV
ncbi:MAG: hypothetical protein K9N23_12735 [Akkermansiaceae bacterium]|nr:hypothetical protein [Akkermansiaceae bacterium]MCF7732550.1 hypothetical protein [Akkermansiaceae bacterium]